MAEFVTFGETLAAFLPASRGLLRYQTAFALRTDGAESGTAAGVQRLGHSAAWLSRLGDDELGQFILRTVRAEGVDTAAVVMDSAYRTGMMVRQTMPDGAVSDSCYREDSAASHLSAADIPVDTVKQARLLYLTGVTPILSAGCREAVYHAIYVALKNHVPIAFDPNICRSLWIYDHTILMRELCKFSNIILLTVDEAEQLYDTRNPARLREVLLRDDDSKVVALKASHSATLISAGESLTVSPSSGADVLASGREAFNAAFLSGILEEKALADCGHMAVTAAAYAAQFQDTLEGLIPRPLLEKLL